MQRETEQLLPAWADPAPVGFIALAVAIFSMVPVFCGWVPSEAIMATLPWGIAAVITLIIVTIIEFRNRNPLAAFAFGAFGIIIGGALTINTVKGFTMFVTGSVAPSPMVAGGMIVDAMAWLALSIAIIFVGLACGLRWRSFAIAVWIGDIGCWIITMVNFGLLGHAAAAVGGYFLLLLGIYFLYIGIAEFVNPIFRKTILPLGGPLFKRVAPPKA
jgi:succinate-acetate transporter protein